VLVLKNYNIPKNTSDLLVKKYCFQNYTINYCINYFNVYTDKQMYFKITVRRQKDNIYNKPTNNEANVPQ